MPVIAKTFKEEGRFETNPFDFYATPIELCRAVLTLISYEKKVILDPGCGTGNWGKAIKEKWPKCYLTGIDINVPSVAIPDYDKFFCRDYPRWEADRKFDLILGNPPFTAKGNKRLAEQFIRKSIDLLAENGMLIFLLPNQFSASKIRFELFKEHMPFNIVQLSERPSFYGNGKTNTHEYSLFMWTKMVLPYATTTYHWLKWKNGVEYL